MAGAAVAVEERLRDARRLELRPPANAVPGLDCAAEPPGTCAWAAVHLAGAGWLNATLEAAGAALRLTVPRVGTVLGTAYGWGGVPMLTAYEADLPVLPWNRTLQTDLIA